MKVKLKETYTADFTTTTRGKILRKTEWLEYARNEPDSQIETMLKNGQLLVEEDDDFVVSESDFEQRVEDIVYRILAVEGVGLISKKTRKVETKGTENILRKMDSSESEKPKKEFDDKVVDAPVTST